ncbi:hypothetical protein CHARACLAT_022218 [Characodon lateralis]|uniref:Uncharacterized protein n=1 Tax=Characodon lateralis TaxID=208331 RepID=A0ABU7EP12_9TELE|nr:hypothetical protein [Characodon lateralis]
MQFRDKYLHFEDMPYGLMKLKWFSHNDHHYIYPSFKPGYLWSQEGWWLPAVVNLLEAGYTLDRYIPATIILFEVKTRKLASQRKLAQQSENIEATSQLTQHAC